MAYVLPSNASGGEVGRLRELVGKYFPIYEARVTPNSLVLAVQVDAATMAEKFDQLRRELWPLNYIPLIRKQTGETLVEIIRRPMRTPWHPYSNVVMLALTMITCLFAGAFLWVAYEGQSALTLAALGWGGLLFAVPLLAILGFHELAHFLVARRHVVEASLPFFIPMPPPFVIFGTFGAFISLREPIPDRKTLLDIGASGPIAGFCIAIPVTLLGLFLTVHNPVVLPITNCGPVFLSVPYGNLVFGVSAIYYALSLFFPTTLVVQTNPLAIAGWVGILVTAINLLPAGQLDGGHVFRALFGPGAVWVSWIAVGALFVLGIFYPGWWIFAFLVLILGARHPPPLNDITPLDWKRVAVGACAAAILVTGFVAVPLSTPTGQFSLQNVALSPVGNEESQTLAYANLTLYNGDIVPHAFQVQAKLTPETIQGSEQLNGSLLDRFTDNLTWTFYWADHGPVTSRGTVSGLNFTLPSWLALQVNETGSGSAHEAIALEISDPMPSTFNLVLTVTEYCASVQNLENGAPQSTSTLCYPTSCPS